MSAPVVYLLGFGEAGPLARQSLASAERLGVDARHIALPGAFSDLLKPQPALWHQIADAIRDEHEALVVWAADALIVWDRLLRARDVSYAPDFLWPLPLHFNNGGIEIVIPKLFCAQGAFELSLYDLADLHSFHHVVTARALSKLLLVSDIETLTLTDYLHQAWVNFESVKAPDTWALHAPDSPLMFANNAPVTDALAKFTPVLAAQSKQWLMAREALAARTRNTMAASEFVRTNLDQTRHALPALMQAHPYYGHWPVKVGHDALTLPCNGYHPVVAAHIWRGEYHPRAFGLWNALYCQGAYDHVTDARDDGHVFGLSFAVQRRDGTIDVVAPSVREASWAQTAIEANNLSNVTVSIGEAKAAKDGVAVLSADNVKSFWGKMDIFIPLEGEDDCAALRTQTMPAGYVVYAYTAETASLDEITEMTALANARALVVVHKERQAKLTAGRS